MTCCGQPMKDDGGQKVCGSCGAWFQGVAPAPALVAGGGR